MSSNQDNSEAMKYIKSLKDAVKRRFATSYLEWVRGGRIGSMPSRGALSAARVKALCLNIDALS